jgi:hypothetical protein
MLDRKPVKIIISLFALTLISLSAIFLSWHWDHRIRTANKVYYLNGQQINDLHTIKSDNKVHYRLLNYGIEVIRDDEIIEIIPYSATTTIYIYE